MRYYTAFILALVLMVACHEGIKAPDGLISKDEFVNVLTDVRILEGYYSSRYERVDTSNGLMAAYYQQIFDKHHTDRLHFEESLKYYSIQPKEMKEIEVQVLERINAMIAEDKARKLNQPADSLSAK